MEIIDQRHYRTHLRTWIHTGVHMYIEAKRHVKNQYAATRENELQLCTTNLCDRRRVRTINSESVRRIFPWAYNSKIM